MLPEAKLAIDAIAGAITLFDKLYPRIMRIVKGEEPKPPSFKIEEEGDAIVARRRGQVLQKVTYPELVKRLPPDGLALISTYERSLSSYQAQIDMVYPQLAVLPPIEKAQTELRLRQMTESIKKDLLGIIDFIQTMGFDLEDHYSRARYEISRL